MGNYDYVYTKIKTGDYNYTKFGKADYDYNNHCNRLQMITITITARPVTHKFLLKGEPPPECIPCNCPLTIKHLLIECVDFNDVRQRFYQVPSLQDLFKTVKPEVI